MVHTLRQYIRHFALSDVNYYASQYRDKERACRLLFTDNKPFTYLFCLTFAGTLHFMQIACNYQYFLQSIPFVAGP